MRTEKEIRNYLEEIKNKVKTAESLEQKRLILIGYSCIEVLKWVLDDKEYSCQTK